MDASANVSNWLRGVVSADHHKDLLQALDRDELDTHNKNSALFLSSRLGKLKCFEVLNQKKVPLCVYDERGRNILHLALSHRHAHMITPVLDAIRKTCCRRERLNLLNTPAYIRRVKESPLALAINLPGKKAVICTKLLLEHGADLLHDTYRPDPSYLNQAVETDKPDLVALLIKHGANVNEISVDSCSPLTCAVQQDSEECAKVLLEAGAIVDQTVQHGDTPLMTALELGNNSMAKLLLNFGADPRYHNRRGWSTVVSAASSGRFDTLKLIVEALGNDHVNVEDEALHMVCQQPNLDSTRLLLQYGWSVLMRDSQGRSVLQTAAQHFYGREEEENHLQLLLEKYKEGADHTTLINDASVALVWACLHGSLPAVNQLLLYGAKADMAVDFNLSFDVNDLALDWEGLTSALFITCQKLVKYTNGSHAFINLTGVRSNCSDLIILARLLQNGCKLDCKWNTSRGLVTAFELVIFARDPWVVVARMLWESGASLPQLPLSLSSNFPLTSQGRAMSNFLKEIANVPRSLYSVSAMVIRESLCRSNIALSKAVDKLMVPNEVRDYLQLKFLDDMAKREESSFSSNHSHSSIMGDSLHMLEGSSGSSGSSVWDFDASISGSSDTYSSEAEQANEDDGDDDENGNDI